MKVVASRKGINVLSGKEDFDEWESYNFPRTCGTHSSSKFATNKHISKIKVRRRKTPRQVMLGSL
jgi:hypothetical protein